MGKKKRSGHSRSNNLPTPPVADKAVQEEKTKALAFEKHITSEIRRARIAFDRGNSGRAQKIMKDLSSLYPNTVKTQFFYAAFVSKEAKSIKDPTAKKRHLKKAVEPARRAMSLSSGALYCFHLYAWLLFELASNADEYSEVMQLCQPTLRRLEELGRRKGILQNDLETLVSCSRYILRQLELKNVNFDAEEFKQKMRANSVAQMRQIKSQYEASQETSEEAWVTEETLQSMDFKEEEERSLGARRLERRKALQNIKKMTSLGGKIAQVRQYWSPLSADTKRGFLRVRIGDLKEHLRSVKNDLALAVLSEAIRFLQEKDSLKFMECCVCDEKFTDLLLYVEHFANKHTGGLSERLMSVLPQEIGSDWVDFIEKSEWKPEDACAVLQIGSHVECTLMDMDVYLQNCVKDPSVEEMKKQFEKVLTEAEIGDQNDEKSGKHEPDGSEWPLSDYTRRAKTLEKIQAMLQMLLKGRYLSRMHVLQVIKYTLEELQIFASELQLRNLGLDKTLRGICLLEFPQLVKVLRFLHSIAYICGITKFPEKDEALAGAQKSEIKETIRFSVDSSYLHLDERLVTGELDVSTFINSISNEGSECAFPDDDYADDTLPGNGLFVPWLLVGRSIEEILGSWARLIEDREHKKIEVFDFLKKEFSLLEILCNMKIMHSVKEESLRNIKIMHSVNEEDLEKIRSTCDDESNRKAQDPAYVPQYLECLLKRKEEPEVADVDDTTIVRSPLDLLSNLHDEVHNMRKTIREHEVQTTLEICQTDARITRILAAMQQEGFKIGEASARAYRSILMISLRSFIGAQLEDLVDKAATEKASAAEEALLEDLALDAKKSGDRGDGKNKQTQKKSKNKYYRKSEDLEASSCGKQFPQRGKDVEQQELRCQVDLEAEERSLETNLESQLRIDAESENQHLAEQNKLGEKIEELSSDETAIGTISQGGLQKPESSSSAEQKTILIGKIPLVFEAEQQELRCRVKLEAEERSLEMTLESQLRIDDESEKQHLAEQNNLGEKIEKHPSDETAIGTISPRGLQKPESSSSGEQNTILIGKIPLVLEKRKSVVFSKGSDDDPSVSEQLAYNKSAPLPSSDSSSDEADDGDPDNEDSKNPDQDDDNGTYQDFPESSERVPQRISPKREEFKALQTDACGAGLKNEDNNCSLNAIIQSLWHLRRFRRELMKSAAHVHVQDDCVYCSLHLIFSLLNLASMCTPKKAVSPAPLRNALSNLDPESNLYKKGEMNDASEILNKILEGLHQPFGRKQEESNIRDHLDCASNDCLAHSLFGIKILERVACYHCGCESRKYAYNSPFHLINASELRKKKITHKDSSFDKLLKLVKMDDQVTCNPEEGGCGKLNSIDQILSIPPPLFVVLLGWQSVRENLEDISTALAALTTEIDIAVIYGGLDEGRKGHLISMVCFHSQHLTCFAYDPKHKNWVHYNDEIVEVIGQWNDVVTKCKQGNFQPQLLFYEAPLDEC